MWQRILVPLDGSARAERALPIAARLASSTGGTVILFRVYQLVPSDSLVRPADFVAADQREAYDYLGQLQARQEVAGARSEVRALGGAVARTILDAVAAYAADSIVITSHGRGGFGRWMLGSVAEHVARHAPVPVLILRQPDPTQPALPGPMPDGTWRALVGLDGSALAEVALAPTAALLRALAGEAPAEVWLMRVIEPMVEPHGRQATPSRDPHAVHAQLVRDVEAYLRAVAQRFEDGELRRYGLGARWSVREATDVATALIHAAEGTSGGTPRREHEAPAVSLVALSTHGLGATRLWALGSIAGRILSASTLPLLLVRAHRPSPTTEPERSGHADAQDPARAKPSSG
jgi:nucleotide-binding universal stress UspA family protein